MIKCEVSTVHPVLCVWMCVGIVIKSSILRVYRNCMQVRILKRKSCILVVDIVSMLKPVLNSVHPYKDSSS